ncbi:MAG: DUF4301 family protein, partial [Proteobacteria bacterium]|nr:DUF4301 family protein [Pseudomonadota bacterium]
QHRLLRNQGCETWPVGPALRSYFKQDPGSTPKAQSIAEMIEEIDQPKALQPCWTDGPSFLQIKSEEHRHIKGIEAEYYVAPLGLSEDFHTHLKQEAKLPSYFLEQGTDLSTLRFLPNGLPYRDESGQVSVVPAGHGMLVRLFKKIHSTTKNAHSLLIRNIDNVTGFSQEFIGETELFLVQHQIVLLAVQNIRKALQSDDLSEASRFAGDLLQNMLNPRPLKPGSWLTELTEPWSSLWRLLVQGFHCPESHAHKLRLKHQDKRALKELYARPVNTLGQVPNSGKDVGGTPVFARSTAGEVSICLELPHVSPIDRQRFLEDPTRATHFNPVFVAAEIPTSTKAYELENCPFWILADKTIHGQAVVYHEIVLYEVIGNSLTANVQFPVISRRLFKPHKSLFDGLKAQI